MTTTVPRDATAADEILAAAERLAPTIAARAAEVEAARRLPPDLVAELTAAGCFRVLLPPSHGGAGADLPAAMRLFETLARADGSAGWTVMIGAGSWCDVAGLPRASFDALYAGQSDTILAGAFNPTGTAVAVDRGYRVNGRWSFASGCEHAAWFFANCVEASDGAPRLRTVVLAPDEVTIEDTWHVAGLAGTGSHHFRADDVVVPAERTCSMLDHEPCLDETIVRVPPPALFALCIATVGVGIARGAFDDVVALANGKVPLLNAAPLADNPTFRFRLGTADTELRAARALLYDAAGAVWAVAGEGSPPTLELRAAVRGAAAWAVERAVGVVETAYRFGGGSSVYLDSPLQRRLRDINALAQHALVRPDTMTTVGAVLAGRDIDVPVF